MKRGGEVDVVRGVTYHTVVKTQRKKAEYKLEFI
jgi:hypothetical protein